MKNTVYTSKEKNYEFSSKKTFTIPYYCLIFCGDFTFSISFSEDRGVRKDLKGPAKSRINHINSEK